MKPTHWIINFRTKQYWPVNNDFSFDGDWKLNTPWPDEDYINLHAQKIYEDQEFTKSAFYGYDLCRDGMLVGVYWDKDQNTRDEIDQFIRELKDRQDVVKVLRHPLKRILSVDEVLIVRKHREWVKATITAEIRKEGEIADRCAGEAIKWRSQAEQRGIAHILNTNRRV